MKKRKFYKRISVLFIVPFLLTIFSQGALAQEVNLCLAGTPSSALLNPINNPGCPNYFGYGTLQINSRINDGLTNNPAVGYLTLGNGYRFSTTVDLVEPSTVNEIEVVFRGLMNPGGAYIKAFIYDGSWQQVGSVNPYSVWGDAIANLPPKTFEFTSGAPWNNVTRVRAETYGNFIPPWFCVQAYIYELRAFGPAAPVYQDIGLRVQTPTGIVSIAAEIGAPTSPLRIAKSGVIYGIALVDPGDPNDSGVRIQTSSGIKALRKIDSG